MLDPKLVVMPPRYLKVTIVARGSGDGIGEGGKGACNVSEFKLIEFHFISSPTISVVGVNLDDGWLVWMVVG